MVVLLCFILLSSGSYQAFFLTIILFLIFSAILYGLYRLAILRFPRFKMKVNAMILALAILLMALFLTGMTTTLITIRQVNKQLGFSYATPHTPKGEFLVVTSVTAGKAMAEAGIKSGDIIQLNDVNDLYKLLIDNQGQRIIVPIVRDGKEFNVWVNIPRLNVPLARVSFLF